VFLLGLVYCWFLLFESYVASYNHAAHVNLGVLIVCAVLGYLGLFIREYPASSSPTFFFQGFSRGLPDWVAPCCWFLDVVGVFLFLVAVFHLGAGVPEFRQGIYVIVDHGKILREITAEEYGVLQNNLFRASIALMSPCYFVCAAYWFGQRSLLSKNKSN